MKKLLLVICLVLTLFLIITFAGCFRMAPRLSEKAVEKAIEKAVEKATDSDIKLDLDEGGAVVKDEKGGETKVGEKVNLPEGWPKDVPVYPDSSFSISSKTKNGETGKNEYSVWGTATKGSAQEVYDWYKSKLSGWEVTTDQYTKSDDGDLAFLYLQNNSYEVSITIGQSEDTISLGMQVIEK